MVIGGQPVPAGESEEVRAGRCAQLFKDSNKESTVSVFSASIWLQLAERHIPAPPGVSVVRSKQICPFHSHTSSVKV